MSRSSVTAASTAVAIVVLGCGAPRSSTQSPPSVPASLDSSGSRTARWPVPDGLPIYGTPAVNSIRVAVFGMPTAVNRPGYYYLPSGSVVQDAVEAAQGLHRVWWRLYSGIERQKSDGSFEVIEFTRNRGAEEEIPLLDGDTLFFGYEVY